MGSGGSHAATTGANFMPSLFDLLARSHRDVYTSSRSTEISMHQQEMVESISTELIAEGLPPSVAADLLAMAGGFDVRPRWGRGRGRHRGGRDFHNDHHHNDHHDDEGVVVDEISDGADEELDELLPVVDIADDLADDLADESISEDTPDPLPEMDVVEDGDEPVELDDIFDDVLDGYGDHDFTLDSDDIAEVVDEIDDPAVDELVVGDNTLTLTQIQQLFEMYFNSIVNNDISNTNIRNTTYIDQSDNSTNTYNIDNSINAVVDQSDNSVSDSYNSSIDNSVNSFELNYTKINLSNIITGERRGREHVKGTLEDDLIGAGAGRDRLSGQAGADSFLFDDSDDCGRRHADVIRDFDAAEGDRILIDADSFDGDGTVSVAENRRQFRRMRKGGEADFLYFQPRGRLFYDANDGDRGFGEGGLMAALRGAPELGADQIQLV